MTITNPFQFRDGMVIVEPVEYHGAFRNPGKGWVPYIFSPVENPSLASGGKEPPPFASLVYCNYLTWAMLEPVEGVYRWDIIDRLVQHWTAGAHNLKIGLGIHLTDPSSIPGTYHVPRWLVETPGMEGRYYDASEAFGRKGDLKYEPSYYNPVFLAKLERFVAALGSRYFETPSWRNGITSFDISTYGMWGEWHSANFTWPSAAVQKATLRRLVDQYADAFPRDRPGSPALTMNVVSYASLGGLDNHEVPYAVLEWGALMFRRGIGWPQAVAADEADFIRRNWLKAKVMGEWGSVDGSIFRFPGGMTTRQAIDHGLSLHVSTLGWWLPGSPLETETVDGTAETLAEYFQKRCGYRLVLRSARYRHDVQPGGTIELSQEWDQTGVARMYERCLLGAWLVGSPGDFALPADTDFDATGWLASANPHAAVSRFEVPRGVPPGTYELRIGLVDLRLLRPSVNIAIYGKDVDDPNEYGRYTLGPLEVIPAATP